ncbi:hypothetical protein EO98_16645 [Methanosarcina sp. 2.H.T.1A.6]|jgi:hypothetical protein|uniref:DUF2073 domain-containing protein n=1 Tax=unclassified Methanosarcina TaxID=2644672 RepID=UPI0006226B00|nr:MULTISPECIES: DUF2073 domain-containing protein [unclassified Methanosarcina]KKG09183.1 hypothetical protein EO92_00950 [Methanosarcina sp. 2.H.A.1B.4]KKG14995.1 hypothetical protein EO94_03700 [Methanosarcina sp. 2.H.T.1A.3]KKG20602.1 hypothetical protein EO96_13260 [Methanosarcina sp. 2.H.T.1A.8]KKG22011.1 hypothetical protein EO98_16645 [Methanosarcina sp. 2.H.T.1A.6]KKG28648.1 hypothetical protein EO97_14125 [Methanosarcina sp. 2.H.T.1A.15]
MQGIQLDLISEARISQMASMEKVRYIIDEVRKGKILVLEKGLNPMEEAKLIEMTMSAIQPDVFSGIEMQSYPANTDVSLLGKFFKKQSNKRLTVIGPANQLKTLKKDRNLISALVSASK